MFSFRGRIGRWDFFIGSVALALSSVIPVFLAMTLIGPVSAGRPLALPMLIGLFVLFAGTVGWIGLALQAKRFRDIGWDPLYLLPAWFMLQILDAVAATAMPQFALGHEKHATIVGALLNFGMVVALMFWPGDGGSESPASLRALGVRRVELPGAAPAAAAPRSDPASSPASFGRRGLVR
jgi:uncharacterized membrane protein YhaH (DUF805 family)